MIYFVLIFIACLVVIAYLKLKQGTEERKHKELSKKIADQERRKAAEEQCKKAAEEAIKEQEELFKKADVLMLDAVDKHKDILSQRYKLLVGVQKRFYDWDVYLENFIKNIILTNEHTVNLFDRLNSKSIKNLRTWFEDATAKAKEHIKKYAGSDKFKEELQKKVDALICAIIDKHKDTLYKKYKQTITIDDYGVANKTKWYVAIDYFIDNVVMKDEAIAETIDVYAGDEGIALGVMSEVIASIVDKLIAQYSTEKEISSEHLQVDVDSLDPIAFEHYCADILNNNGWSAKVTQATGDQGIDVMGTYNGKKVVFQCKKYSNPVGNKAVQEANAGKGFEGAEVAAVVTNNTYTPSARQLASAIGVYLLHYSELASFGGVIDNIQKPL